jgi:hypothetical protein
VEFLVERRPLSVRHRNAVGLLPIQISAANDGEASLGAVHVLAAKWPECIKRPRRAWQQDVFSRSVWNRNSTLSRRRRGEWVYRF